MELGLFTMPSHPPERDLREGWEWDLQVIEWADEFGFGKPGSASTMRPAGSRIRRRTC